MKSPNSTQNESFGLLPKERRSAVSVVISATINIAVAGGLLLLSLTAVHALHPRHMVAHDLVFTPPPKLITSPPQRHLVIPPPTMASKIFMPPPKLVHAPPKIKHLKLQSQNLPKIPVAPRLRIAPPPKPKVGLFKSFKATEAHPRTHAVVHTADFGNAVGKTSLKHRDRRVTVGAFGASTAAASHSPHGTVTAIAFGSGVAKRSPGSRDHVVVASAGFSNGVAGDTGSHHAPGKVASAAFGGNMYGKSGSRAVRRKNDDTTPIVVTYKPLPTYTAQALKRHIQGNVTLKVRFTAGGAVQVLSVVSGLGYGLNKQAELAARQIRFKPAKRNGHPVDAIRIIRISFQMT